MSGFIGTTSGGPLLIHVSIPINATLPGLLACQPTVDGKWAGSYGFGQAVPDDFRKEGVMSAVRPWGSTASRMLWSTSRVYASIPAGLHQFGVQCATDSAGSFVGNSVSMLVVVSCRTALIWTRLRHERRRRGLSLDCNPPRVICPVQENSYAILREVHRRLLSDLPANTRSRRGLERRPGPGVDKDEPARGAWIHTNPCRASEARSGQVQRQGSYLQPFP